MELREQIARQAALHIVDEGMEYGPAKKRAVKQLQLERLRHEQMPDNDEVEREVRVYLQELDDPAHAQALIALRVSALELMQRLERFRPHLTGAVWRGTATQMSDIHLQLFEDDTKHVEMEMANMGIDYQVGAVQSFTGRGMVDVLSFTVPCSLPKPLARVAMAHVALYLSDDERGALKQSANGFPVRGNLAALRHLMAQEMKEV